MTETRLLAILERMVPWQRWLRPGDGKSVSGSSRSTAQPGSERV
jgi:hypothetical protein